MKQVFFTCKYCGKIEVVGTHDEGEAEMKEWVCNQCHDKYVVSDAIDKYKNLSQTVRELNKHMFIVYEEECEDLGSNYNFQFSVTKDGKRTCVRIYDKREQFNINYDEEIAEAAWLAHCEFGFPYRRPASKIDEIQGKLTDAIKKDFKRDDVVLEWVDGVVMEAWF